MSVKMCSLGYIAFCEYNYVTAHHIIIKLNSVVSISVSKKTSYWEEFQQEPVRDTIYQLEIQRLYYDR